MSTYAMARVLFGMGFSFRHQKVPATATRYDQKTGVPREIRTESVETTLVFRGWEEVKLTAEETAIDAIGNREDWIADQIRRHMEAYFRGKGILTSFDFSTQYRDNPRPMAIWRGSTGVIGYFLGGTNRSQLEDQRDDGMTSFDPVKPEAAEKLAASLQSTFGFRYPPSLGYFVRAGLSH